MVNVPPVTITFVGASVLPALLVHEPSVLTSISPPMVVFVPLTFTAEEVDTLLPPLVAVFPVNVMLGFVPFNRRLAPPTKMPPPRLPAALLVKLVLATVVAKDSTRIPPPFPGLAELFEIVEVPIVAEPVPPPPGAAKPKTNRSKPPPPEPIDPAVFRLIVDPLIVSMPVAAVCCGAEGVNMTPPPLPP